jgi:hypothetical protein
VKQRGWDVVRLARASAGTGTVDGKQVDVGLRCTGCGRRLAEYAAAPYAFKCPRCKSDVRSAPGLTAATE